MLKFFRKIRQNLLSQQKLKKYLIYAVGEIVLVVIGILIALSINTWSEQKKEEKLELSILLEMISNLEADISDMQINKVYHENAILSAEIILNSFEQGIPQHDSLNKHYGKVSLVPNFLRTETAYISIQDQGMRILSNDSLRFLITQYYENNTQFLKDYIDSEWNVQFQDTRDISRKYFKKFEVFAELIPEDYFALSKNQKYKNYLNNRIGWSKVTVGLYDSNIQAAEKLMNKISTECKNRGIKE